MYMKINQCGVRFAAENDVHDHDLPGYCRNVTLEIGDRLLLLLHSPFFLMVTFVFSVPRNQII
jgi:hypothetical protein